MQALLQDGPPFQCREGGAENNCSGKRNFCFAEHFLYLLVELCDLAPNIPTAQRYPGLPGWEFDPVTKQWHHNTGNELPSEMTAR